LVTTKNDVMKKIHFEDCGQDFLWWIIDDEGNVVDCGPFQASVWVGSTVYMDELEVGEPPMFNSRFGDDQLLNYSVTKIEDYNGNE
jgi:hypothetical protein